MQKLLDERYFLCFLVFYGHIYVHVYIITNRQSYSTDIDEKNDILKRKRRVSNCNKS